MGKISQAIMKIRRWGIVIDLLLLLIVTVSAASIQVTRNSYQSEVGGALNVANGLGLTDKGFTTATIPATVTMNCPTGNVTFGITPGTANTAITSGHFVYDAQVSTTASTPAHSCFTVTLTITPNSGSPTTFTVKIASGSTVSAGETIDCQFDVGASLPTPPYSFLAKAQ